MGLLYPVALDAALNIKGVKKLELITRAQNAIRNKPADFYDNPSDRFIAGLIVRGAENRKARKKLVEEILKHHPEMIKVKREQLKLRREIRNAARK